MTRPPWHNDKQLQRLVKAIADAGGEARLVGGCVRDWLADRPVVDLDLATDLPPPQTTETLTNSGFKVIPTGIDHGTVTAVMDGRSFEVTTLRTDLETDGRHATVGFTRDWLEDARRRDFTVNALYADLDGAVYDPLGNGQSDLQSGLLRFVGTPDARIQEDYLRILRFHRFASETGFHQDQAGLSATARLAPGLASLSAERVWQEMKRLLAGSNRWSVLRQIAVDGTLAQVLPEAQLADWQTHLPDGDPLLLLAALAEANADSVGRRWKLSKPEFRRLVDASHFRQFRPHMSSQTLFKQAWRDGKQATGDRLVINSARTGGGHEQLLSMLEAWDPPDFPLRGQDILEHGVSPGPDVGAILRAVENWWIEQAFAPDREACLAELRRLASPH